MNTPVVPVHPLPQLFLAARYDSSDKRGNATVSAGAANGDNQTFAENNKNDDADDENNKSNDGCSTSSTSSSSGHGSRSDSYKGDARNGSCKRDVTRGDGGGENNQGNNAEQGRSAELLLGVLSEVSERRRAAEDQQQNNRRAPAEQPSVKPIKNTSLFRRELWGASVVFVKTALHNRLTATTVSSVG